MKSSQINGETFQKVSMGSNFFFLSPSTGHVNFDRTTERSSFQNGSFSIFCFEPWDLNISINSR